MVFDEYFFIIPVYRLSEEKYYSNLKNSFETWISKTWNEDFILNYPEIVQNSKNNHRSSYGGGWEFNEIVGYVKLHFLGTQIRGEYWATIPKRKVRTRRKQFEYKTHKLAAEIEIRDFTQEGIIKAVDKYIGRCKKEVKNRHLDLREFDKLKAHINWSSLYKANNSFTRQTI